MAGDSYRGSSESVDKLLAGVDEKRVVSDSVAGSSCGIYLFRDDDGFWSWVNHGMSRGDMAYAYAVLTAEMSNVVRFKDDDEKED